MKAGSGHFNTADRGDHRDREKRQRSSARTVAGTDVARGPQGLHAGGSGWTEPGARRRARQSGAATMSALALTVGSEVWVEDEAEAWLKATVTKIDGTTVTIEDENGLERVVEEATEEKLPLQNPRGKGGVDDMTQLSYLNEPGVLHNLKDRYSLDSIYTYTGSILIAVNPFYPVPQLYGEHMMYSYRDRMLGELSPHVYAIAEEAFRQMSQYSQSQSVLISGESGAGKTETSKLIMNYLAFVGGHSKEKVTGEKTVEQQVLESNPILEAFGNAKTVRNNNSSRFGKYMEIQFDSKLRISGAAIRTYLLERSRVVFVNDPERTFHSFYQLCYGADEEERAALKLKPAQEYKYLAQSTCFEIEDMGNAEGYRRTKEAMSIVGMTEEEQQCVFRVVAIVLHLGNVVFVPDPEDDEKCVLSEDSQESMSAAAELLGTQADLLEKALSTRTRHTFDGAITSPLSAAAATHSRDSLSKTIYSKLFDWLVQKINTSIGQDEKSELKIGVLDIYGFEQFKKNDFEQFCINLANEKLQQHFNQQVFKKEQEEYKKEEIEWTYIEFVDNQDILNLIEKKPGGMIDLLDEQCQFPKATSADFAQKLYNSFTENTRFSKPKLSRSAFTLNHYAGEVTYETDNFLEKNKDYVIAEHKNILASSDYDFVSSLFKEKESEKEKEEATKGRRKSVSAFRFASLGNTFKGQLKELMAALSATEPHYVRCIKPNQVNKPGIFETMNVLHQLRCGGVLEAIRISCAGYPSRSQFYDFVERFGLLYPALYDQGLEESDMCKSLLEMAKLDGYQIGKTKIFLKGGQMAMMDKLRTERMNAAATMIARHMMTFVAKKNFDKKKDAIVTIQSGARSMFARRLFNHKRQTRAATKVQAAYRGHKAFADFNKKKHAAVQIQSLFRGMKAKRRANGLKMDKSALTVQRIWKGAKERKKFLHHRNSVTKVQGLWRAKKAKQALRQLRVEARQAASLLKDKKALETKMKDMEQNVQNLQEQKTELRAQLKKAKTQLSEAAEREAGLTASLAQAESLKAALEEEQKQAEATRAEVAALTESLQTSQDAKSVLETELEEARSGQAKLKEELAVALKDLEFFKNENAEMAKATEGSQEKDKRMDELAARLAEAQALNSALNDKLAEVEKTPNGKAGSFMDGMRRMSNGVQSTLGAFSNESTPAGATPETRWSEHSTDSHMSELDKQQRELEQKKLKLRAEKQGAQQRKLLEFLLYNKDFQDGVSVGACTTFKCLLQWNAFQAERTTIFDQIIQSVGGILEENQDNNDVLAHWLTNSVTLLALFRKFVRPPWESGIQRRTRAASGLFAFKSSMIFSRSPAVSEKNDRGRGDKQVEAKYPALLFKQQLDAFVQKIFSLLRDNIKRDIAPTLNHCIHAPRGRTANNAADRKAGGSGPKVSSHWTTVINIMQSLLQLMKDTHVPKFLVRKLFRQIFAFVNVQLFNQLLLRRECCSFSNGEYVRTGLAQLEQWIHVSGTDFVGISLDELKQIRQAINFLNIHQKPKKTLEEITNDLCPVLSVQQLYRISTMVSSKSLS